MLFAVLSTEFVLVFTVLEYVDAPMTFAMCRFPTKISSKIIDAMMNVSNESKRNMFERSVANAFMQLMAAKVKLKG